MTFGNHRTRPPHCTANRPQRRAALGLLAAASALLLAACGGGGGDAETSSDTGRDATVAAADRAQPLAFYPTAPIPADANTRGMWTPIYRWPLIPVHALLLPDGRVLSYGTKGDGTQTGFFIYDVWDGRSRPDLASGHLTLPNGTATDIFCNTQILLPNANNLVFQAGGDNWTGTSTTNRANNNTTLFNGATNALSRGPNLNLPRWYATSTALANGEIYIQGGSSGTAYPEIRGLNGALRRLNVSTSTFDYYYPRNFVAPDGRIFGFESAGKMYYVNPNGNGAVSVVGQLATQYTGFSSSAAMYRPGRILQIGATNSNTAATIDITGGAPVVRSTGSLSQQRIWVNATVLPNGRVLATGGSPIPNWYGGANNSAEIWDPQTGVWTRGASGGVARLYHSMALLLPDASVLVGGGGAPGPLTNTNVEVYYPPYLFTAQRTLASRPTITAAPTVLDVGKTFSVTVGNTAGIGRVSLVKTGSVTHSFNSEQRFLDLTFQASGNALSIQAPTRAADAPPGTYMLFVVDRAGVPSVARILKLNIAANPNPAVTPTLVNPGARSTQRDTAVQLALAASDPNGDTLRFAATGLPTGLTINATTGVISGRPTAAGNFTVVASATDGVNTASVSFAWSITSPSIPLEIDSVSAPEPTLADDSVSYVARATGENVRFRWDFGDGSVSRWSSSGRITHTYDRAGTYTVTLSVTDGQGVVLTRSFLQVVGLPLTSRRPTQSGPLLFEAADGDRNARLWVVNPDNDSVTVFDAERREKIAEVDVERSPRTLAMSRNGEIWVVNKRSGSLSILDPDSRRVVRTIELPRASLPYGVAMSPVGYSAYVVLEGLGEVLRFDTRSYSQRASVKLAPNIRHVSVSADGEKVYVSRFITPPLPGESTARVDTSGNVGGQVFVLAATTLEKLGTTVLRHTNTADSETEGRGIPNYLGAVAISPDGTQAWVPSKLDNIKRGTQRDGLALNFQNTVRAVSSRIVMRTGREDLSRRIDHDNASMASAAAYDRRGNYLFVALETSREVAVLDAHSGRQLMRFDVGRAPQGLQLSGTGRYLYVHNFMDRTVSVHDLKRLLDGGVLEVSRVDTLSTVRDEKLEPEVLRGKQFFYDARDERLSRDRYMSCASCHDDGGHDGRVWDLTSQGEGLRNTINLRGRSSNGYLHWSANFDEVQDFENQIRTLAGGTGLMTDAQFAVGTRSEPLGDKKAGVSADLDALAAYVSSLGSVDTSPYRPKASELSDAAVRGKAIFREQNCASCHAGTVFTGSGMNTPVDIGTIKPTSGKRLFRTLRGIDIPTLRDVWMTAPYLHDGSASTLQAAVRAHEGVSLSSSKLDDLADYLREIGKDEPVAPQKSGQGRGLSGEYFANATLSGEPVVTRTEDIDFDWGAGRPAAGIDPNQFSVRWTGTLEAPATGTYWFRTISADGVRVTIGSENRISNWTRHARTVDESEPINLKAGRKYRVVVEYFEATGSSEIRLQWKPPGFTAYSAVPQDRLYAP